MRGSLFQPTAVRFAPVAALVLGGGGFSGAGDAPAALALAAVSANKEAGAGVVLQSSAVDVGMDTGGTSTVDGQHSRVMPPRFPRFGLGTALCAWHVLGGGG